MSMTPRRAWLILSLLLLAGTVAVEILRVALYTLFLCPPANSGVSESEPPGWSWFPPGLTCTYGTGEKSVFVGPSWYPLVLIIVLTTNVALIVREELIARRGSRPKEP